MKTLIVGVGAFGFAVLKHLSQNHREKHFYASEINSEILQNLQQKRQSPYFFSWVTLWENISFLDGKSVDYHEYDLLIVAIPAQFVGWFFENIKASLKPWVTILNLAKGINNTTLESISEVIASKLQDFDYHYAVLSGGMIAQELVDEKMLGATIACQNLEVAQKLQKTFESEKLKIEITHNVKNTELISSIKNIIALFAGYLEGKGNGNSTFWFYVCELYKELPELFLMLGWEKHLDFTSFAFTWDMVATCFWFSRNRYFGQLVWGGKTSQEAYEILKLENKHAEWYETLKGIWEKILANKNLKYFGEIVRIFQ